MKTIFAISIIMIIVILYSALIASSEADDEVERMYRRHILEKESYKEGIK